MKLRTLGLALLVLGLPALLLGTRAVDDMGEATYGASRVAGQPGIAIHWVLCDGVAPRSVDLEGYWGGSQLPTAVPVFWQVRSDAPPAEGTRVVTYVVGQTPVGFYETVPLRQQLPDDLIGISAPPGDETSINGMTFDLDELRRDAIYRGGYVFVSPEQFARDGATDCAGRAGSPVPALGLASLGLGGLLVAGRRRPILAVIAALFLIGGMASLVGPRLGMASPFVSRQPSSAFASGATTAAERQILADLSPETSRSDGGRYVSRFVAPDGYAFAVSCEGPSIQIGEASDNERGATGSRQVIGCATDTLVRGAIADRGDRADLVELVVNPNGMRDWRVVVVAGGGAVGPFHEP